MTTALRQTQSQANRVPHGQIESTPCALDNFISRPEFCRRYRISQRTAEMMAHQGKGPKVTHLGKRAFYHVDDIAAWCEAQRAKSESRFAEGEEAR